ncbi:hypothetical protein [uncultured Paraglaciecola sp.]|uniref:hypothetical protein n=1 Tax=uncultured Paraglaciecola sp. TaxID=1765024 RepID=UPI0026207EAF|nr:hypothetical protein [uncultured Paraglaciecola sp.]
MTETEKTELSNSEKAFKALSPWMGAGAFLVCLFYLLERNQEIPWYVFGLCGILMGLGKMMLALKDLKP